MKRKKGLVIVGIVILAIISQLIYSNFSIKNQLLKREYSEEIIYFDEPIFTFQKSLDYSKEKVLQWGTQAYLNYFTCFYEGEEEIKSREGSIRFNFSTTKSDEKCLEANATVDVDMKSNAIMRFGVSYDPLKTNIKITYENEKVNLNSVKEREIEFEKWNIDIDDVFEIAIKEFGMDEILKYDNPKVSISSWLNTYEFQVRTTGENPQVVMSLEIDPITGKILNRE